MPAFSFLSNAPPSLFAYPPDVTPPTTVAPTKVTSAVLSVAKKKEQRDKKAEEEKKRKEDAMEVEAPKEEPNPARVTQDQLKYIAFEETSRYHPLKADDPWGILMLRDSKPGTPEELVTPTSAASSSSAGTDEAEPEPPEPFEYNPN